MKSTWLVLLLSLAYTLPLGAQENPNLEKRLAKAYEKFPEADSNQDGKLTAAEFRAFQSEMRASHKEKKKSDTGVPDSTIQRYGSEELLSRYEAQSFSGIDYRWFFPKKIEAGKKYPLILSLHGAGGKGTNNRKNLKVWNGVITEPAFQEKYPCFITAPQSNGPWQVENSSPEVTEEMLASFPELWQKLAPHRSGWLNKTKAGNLQTVFALLDHLADEYPIDADRLYVLGHSMGGFGSFEAIAMQPQRFAAAIPSAGGLSPWHSLETFKHVPIWAFHGDKDDTVPYALSQLVFDQMKDIGGNMKLTRLGGVGHGANAYAFVYQGDETHEDFSTYLTDEQLCDATSDVWEWLFRQKRTTP